MLSVVPDDARSALLAAGVERQYAANEVLYLAGSEAISLHLVLEGRVRIVREHRGRTTFIHDEGPGGSLGEVPLLEGSGYPATAIAAEATRCLLLDRDAIRGALRQHPDLALAMLVRLAGRVRGLVERLERVSSQPTTGRLAALILTRAPAGISSFTLGGTQQQVAEEIGTVRELVVRGLRSLREQGAIERTRNGRYIVRDDIALRRLAGEEPRGPLKP